MKKFKAENLFGWLTLVLEKNLHLLQCHGVGGRGKRIDGSSYFAIMGVSDFGMDASGIACHLLFWLSQLL